ncbi:MAG: aldose epimerase [Paenibacillus sp.]|jgi:galactose mutarotase-like enzyme|nr:aldose epimerase [Paenibacillus sp.]
MIARMEPTTLIRLQNEVMQVEVNKRGAELHSFKLLEDKETQYLWQGDPGCWSSRSPLLFPIIGSLKEGSYTYEGTRYALPTHGFAKSEMFELERHTADNAVFVLRSSPSTVECYPFEFELRLSYTLTGNRLNCQYTVDNTGDKEMYFSIGAHPGFALHAPSDQYYLLFELPETIHPHRTENRLVLDAPEHVLLQNERRWDLNADMFVRGAYVCKRIQSRKLLLCSDLRSKAVEVGWEGFSLLGIWTKPGAPFICIEPWTGHGDTASCSGKLREKPMITCLASGKRFRAKMDIAIKDRPEQRRRYVRYLSHD